jgi:hypothetical protein
VVARKRGFTKMSVTFSLVVSVLLHDTMRNLGSQYV